MELYVYYRVNTADAAPALQAVRSFQQALRQQFPGVAARVLQRPAVAPHDPSVITFMEVYHRAPDPLNDAMIQTINVQAEERLAPWVHGERHVEVFLPA